MQTVRAEIEELVSASGAEIAVYYADLEGPDSLLLSADLRMHAASTMKVPVMMQLFMDRDAGLLSLDDSLEVKTAFRSIVDGSPYSLTSESDSDTGLNNLEGQGVTYRDLGVTMAALGRRQVGAEQSAEEMLEILGRQQWRTKIPAQLPEGTRVAHRTGRITGISHDAGIVFPESTSPYVLVVLTRGFEDPDEADASAARISRVIYDFHVGGKGE